MILENEYLTRDINGFVCYHPAMGMEDEKEEASSLQAIADVREFVKMSHSKYGHAVRGAHAKAYGGVIAEIEIYKNLPEAYAQGIFAFPAKYESVMRFSNGKAHLGPDHLLGGAVGIGLKILGVPGATLLEPENSLGNVDLVMINSPVFAANDVQTYLNIQRLSFEVSSREMAFYNLLSSFGSLPPEKWLWENFFAFLRLGQLPVQNVLLSTYWTMAPSRFGKYVAKLSIVPLSSSAEKVTSKKPMENPYPEFFHESLKQEIASHDYEFEICAQLCRDPQRMPIDRVTVEWPESLSPPVPVARIRIPMQNLISEDIIDRLSMNPWRVPEEHMPIGSIQRIRKRVYQSSADHRHRMNGQPDLEPCTLSDLFKQELINYWSKKKL